MLSLVQIDELATNLVSQLKLILWEMKLLLIYTLPFIPINLHLARWMKMHYINHSNRRPAPSYRHVFSYPDGVCIPVARRTGVIQANAKQVRGARHVQQGKVPSSITPVCARRPLCASFTHKNAKRALVLLATLQKLPLYCIHVFQQLISYHLSARLQLYK